MGPRGFWWLVGAMIVAILALMLGALVSSAMSG